MKERVIVITGPTASGKTRLAVHIAKNIGGEIVSADSMQIYREMNIGTAKPTIEEMQGIPHYMLDEVSIQSPYSVALYQKKAFSHIRDILRRGKVPVVAGGTGLYINSLLFKLDFTKTIRDEEYRNALEKLPVEELHARLGKLDDRAAARIHKNDKKRLIRRLEILKSGGDGAYDFREKNESFDFCCVGVKMDRNELYKRIEERVDSMIRGGLADEVKEIYGKYPANLISLKAIGYKEIIGYLEGLCTLEEAVADIKKNTRRFAKRQLTWFNNDERIKWFSLSEYTGPEELQDAVMQYVCRRV
jgi:tRNA dimethylallyltransferase